jgi:hypothetical protein
MRVPDAQCKPCHSFLDLPFSFPRAAYQLRIPLTKMTVQKNLGQVVQDCTCSHWAMTRTFFRSTSKSSLRPGRCTFTTTRLPRSLAKCTWPSEAAAMGLNLNSSKIASTGCLKARSIVALTAPPPNGGTCTPKQLKITDLMHSYCYPLPKFAAWITWKNQEERHI